MPVCHILTGPFWPERGGMEDSIARVAGLLDALGIRVQIYVRLRVPEGPRDFPELRASVVYFDQRKEYLLAPRTSGLNGESTEEYRLDYLLFREQVREQLALCPSENHVLVSFFISSSGFVAQHVASELRLPHVAVCQGSDVSTVLHDPRRLPAIEFVVRRASALVTVSREQEGMLRAVWRDAGPIRTIANSLPEDLPERLWVRSTGGTLRLVSDAGYDHKKGTHLLIDAFRSLRATVPGTTLTIAGKTWDDEREYWAGARRRIEDEFGDAITFLPYMSRAEIYDLILRSDVYCSATLGEGCSNARLAALALGIPIVTTRCGEMVELHSGLAHVALATPGDPASYTEALLAMARQWVAGTVVVRPEGPDAIRRRFTSAAERAEWNAVLRDVGVLT